MKKKMSVFVFFSTLFLLFLFGLFANNAFGAEAKGDYLALTNREYTERANKSFKTTRELYIEKVLEGGPADKAGLLEGDQILAVNDEPVAEIDEIVAIINAHSPNDLLKMSIQRENQSYEVEVTLGANEQEEAFLGVVLAFEMMVEDVQVVEDVQAVEELKEINEHAAFAERFLEWVNRLAFRHMTPDGHLPDVTQPPVEIDKAQLPEGEMLQGAMIREVIADTPAEAAGLQENDVITAINGQTVDSLQTFRDLIQAHDTEEKMNLTVERRGESEPLNLEVTVAEKSDNTAYLGVQVAYVWHVEHREGTLPEGFDEEEFVPEIPAPPFDEEWPTPPDFRPPHFDLRDMPKPPDFPRPPFGDFPKPPRFP